MPLVQRTNSGSQVPQLTSKSKWVGEPDYNSGCSFVNCVNSSFVESQMTWFAAKEHCEGIGGKTGGDRLGRGKKATVVKEINRRGCKDLTAGCYLSFLWGKSMQCHSCQQNTGFFHNYLFVMFNFLPPISAVNH